MPDDVFKEGDGFVIHRRFEFVGEFRIAAGVHALVLVEAIEAEPLAEKLGRKTAGLWIGDHAAYLAIEIGVG